MATRSQVQFEWGTTSEIAAATLTDREVVVDSVTRSLVVMDGVTVGGKRQASEAYVIAQIAALASGNVQNLYLFNNVIYP
jgi:hypothetical protein